jgi:hypothetical protein
VFADNGPGSKWPNPQNKPRKTQIMKLITRSAIVLVFLLGLATPLLAQNPVAAIRIGPPLTPKACFPVTVKNLRPAPIQLNGAYMAIFDQSNCKLVCESKISLANGVGPCQTHVFTMCCSKPLPSKFICYVRVKHNLGTNEEWFFRP